VNLERRIRALEGRLVFEAITLVLPDGSERKIPGDGDYRLRLAIEAMRIAHARHRGEPEPQCSYAQEFQWIQQSVSDNESGHMLDLVRIALATETSGQPEVSE